MSLTITKENIKLKSYDDLKKKKGRCRHTSYNFIL